ncbi:MAG: ATP-binding protein [Aeoliella sp.]
MQHLFDTRPERPGFRLHRLEVFNWGTFDSTDGQVYRFEPEGRTALLVGHNGSGKSTLVDAVLTLLVEPRTRNYNVAAGGHKRERTEQSYIRGAYSRSSDDAGAAVAQYLRPQAAHLTALLAIFRDEQLDREFTLCQVLHLSAGGAVDKLYAIADEARELKADLAGLRSSDLVSSHMQQIGYQTTKKFIEYHGWLTKRTGARAKAMDMFNQTVAVKDIQSLNEFIRLHMLEAHDWREKVAQLLRHFNDLSEAHRELVRARKSEELLAPVEKRGLRFREKQETLAAQERKLAAADLFFRAQTVRLFQPEILAHQQKLTSIEAVIQRLTSERTKVQEQVRQLKNEIDRTGGDRLRAIPGEIEVEKGKLTIKRPAFERYHRQLKLCEVHETVGKSRAFDEVREKLRAFAVTNAQQIRATELAHEEQVSLRGELRRKLREETDELKVLAGQSTNLPPEFKSIRDSLCEDLQITERDVPFAAELIAVDPEQRHWEASAEMVLRSFALSLLVPDRLYLRVRNYIEQTRLEDARGEGKRLEYLRVGKASSATGDRLHPQSIVRKLKFRERHPLAAWVRGEIERRFDYQCCESIEQFDDAARLALTTNRHIKMGGDLHKKDDRRRTVDPRYFVLGWNNREKKQRIAEQIETISNELSTLDADIDAKSCDLEQLRASRLAAQDALETTEFDAIDIERHRRTIRDLETERRQLEQSNNTVRVLKKKQSKAESEEKSLESDRDGAIEEKTRLR